MHKFSCVLKGFSGLTGHEDLVKGKVLFAVHSYPSENSVFSACSNQFCPFSLLSFFLSDMN